MNRRANYSIWSVEDDRVVIMDEGPWDVYLSVTNAAEQVVQELLPRLGGRRLFYYDSGGDYSELLIKDGKFAGFINNQKEPCPDCGGPSDTGDTCMDCIDRYSKEFDK